jgi:hypothetical protein
LLNVSPKRLNDALLLLHDNQQGRRVRIEVDSLSVGGSWGREFWRKLLEKKTQLKALVTRGRWSVAIGSNLQVEYLIGDLLTVGDG